jgi:hypothetical protein
MKLIEKFKLIMPHVTVLAAEDIKTLRNASDNGDLKLIDETLSKKKFRINPIPVDDIFQNAFAGGHLDIINYLLNSPHAKEFHNVALDNHFRLGCMCNKRNFVEEILNSEEVTNRVGYKNVESLALIGAVQRFNFDVVDFLISSPKFKDKLDIHAYDDIVFKNVFQRGSNEMLNYLIFDMNLSLTQGITHYLKTNYNQPNKNKQVFAMFEVRDLKTELESTSNVKLNVAKKRLKI